MPVSNYTFLNTPEAEERIQRDQDVIAQALEQTLQKSLLSVVMIGGYGRGEGGIYNANGDLRPYNDYDYFLVLDESQRYSEKKRNRELQPIKHELEDKLNIEQRREIGKGILDGMKYLLRIGLWHCDFKLENILLLNGKPLIVDFGLVYDITRRTGYRQSGYIRRGSKYRDNNALCRWFPPPRQLFSKNQISEF